MFEGMKKVATMKMGPNDAYMFFHVFYFFIFFFILTNIFRFYLCYEGAIRDRGGQGKENGPK